MARKENSAASGILFVGIFALIGLGMGTTTAWLNGNLDHLFAASAPSPAFTAPPPVTASALERTVLVGIGDADNPCTVEIDGTVYPHLQKLGIDKWPAACREARSRQP